MTIYTKGETLLQVKDMSLSYGDKCILRDINFNICDIVRPGIQQGQVVSVIGRSGIGKTQLFRVLSGLQQPSSGSVTVPGRNASGKADLNAERRYVRAGDMGVIFQNYYLFGWRTIYQSLMLAARQNKALQGKEQAAIEQYTSRFDVSDVLHLYPRQLSGGQQQRASIIQQLLKGSDFLLLDEPFSGLDICVLDKVVELLLQVSLSDELKTLIIVSHDIPTTVAISDTVFVLGRQSGKPGSTIIKEIDLIERGLAWEKDVRDKSTFGETIKEIRGYL